MIRIGSPAAIESEYSSAHRKARNVIIVGGASNRLPGNGVAVVWAIGNRAAL